MLRSGALKVTPEELTPLRGQRLRRQELQLRLAVIAKNRTAMFRCHCGMCGRQDRRLLI